MRTCNKTFHIRLSDKAYEKLFKLSEITGLTKSGYIRFMIAGISPREKPSEDYFKYFREMHKVGNLLNQIARQLYYFKQMNYKNLDEALGQYTELSNKILADKDHDKADVNQIIIRAKEHGIVDVSNFEPPE